MNQPKNDLRMYALLLCLALPFGALDILLPWYMITVGGNSIHIGLMSSAAAATTLLVRPVVGHYLPHGALRIILYLGTSSVLIGLLIWSIATSWYMLIVGRMWAAGGISAVVLSAQVIIARSDRQGGSRFGKLSSVLFLSAAIGSVLAGILLLLFDRETQTEVQGFIQTWGLSLPLPEPNSTLTAFHQMYLIFALISVGAFFCVRFPWSTTTVQAPQKVLHIWKNLSKHVQIRQLILAQLLIRCAYSASVPLLIVFLSDRFGASLITFAVAYALPGMLYLIMPSLGGQFADRIGLRRAIWIGLSLSVCVYAALPWIPVLVGISLLWACEALAYGLYAPAYLALLAQSTRSSDHGALFSLNSVVADIGALIAAPLGGLLYSFVPWLPFTLSALAFLGAGLIVRGTYNDHSNSAHQLEDRV